MNENNNINNTNNSNNTVTGLQNAQREGNLRKDSDVQRRKQGIGSRTKSSSLNDSQSKSSNNIANNSTNVANRSSNSNTIKSSSNARNSNVAGNKPSSKANAVNRANQRKLFNHGPKSNLTKGNVAGLTTAGRIYNALNTSKNIAKSVGGNVRAAVDKKSDSMDTGDNANETENPMNQRNQEMSFQDISIRVPRIVKIAAIVSSCFLVVVFVLIAALTNTDTIRKLIIQKFALSVLEGEAADKDSEDSISEGKEFAEELDAFIINRDYTVYLKGNTKYIDDDIKSTSKFLAYSTSEDVDLSGLKKYYKLNCSGKECEKTDLYRFYRKFYDIYFLYRYKYNVKLNLALLMATIDYNSTEQENLFKKHLNDYSTDEVRTDNYNNDNITNLDWEYDYQNIDGYTYLNANDFRYDMQILAKNMVTKKTTYTCSGSDGASSGETITDNSKKGDGWDSVTKVKYENGTERTFRNYKQYQGTYANQSFWKSGTAKTIAGAGCGPTSVAIVLSGYGYDAGPGKVVKVMQDVFKKDDAANFNNLTEPLKHIGNIKAEIHSGRATTADIKKIRDNFKKGRPVIINAPNHYVVYVGEDKNGKLIISDPGSSDGGNARYGATLEDVVNNGNITYGYILITSDGNSSSTSSTSSKKTTTKEKKKSSSNVTTNEDGSKTMNDVETSNYDKKLKCDSGTYDKDSVSETYELDLDKYDEFLLEYIEHKFYLQGTKVSEKDKSTDVTGDGQLTIDETNKRLCKGVVTPGVYQSSEPCPNMAILYWKQYLKQSDFVFPIDKKTKLPLGAWPKDYKKYPTQISGYKTYHKYYIWPITPSNNTYTTVYTHQSMDIMSKFGTPVYSPVDGSLVYSEWGGTVNRGSDETAYTVTITPSHTVTYGGTAINTIFLTHMAGIRYRCGRGQCNRTVKKGELLGFSGNAAGDSYSVGWAPHLHMTFYNSSSYNGTGLYTPTLENFYNIKNNTKRKVGE